VQPGPDAVHRHSRSQGPRLTRVELLRTDRLLLRHWNESDLTAFFGLYSLQDVEPGPACEDPPCPQWSRMSPTTFFT